LPPRAALLLLVAALGGLASTVPRAAVERDPYSRLLASTVWVNAANHGKGTGWVVDRGKRWVVTCYHVVGDGDAVEVMFPWRSGGKVVSTRREYLTHAPELRKRGLVVRAKVLRRNLATDLALLELASLPEGIEALPLASDSAPPGATVHLVGNRYDVEVLWTYAVGEVRFRHSLREGYFSGGKQLAKGATALTASVPINEGDSGGPLVDDAGRLVGVAAAVAWEANGAGLFIDVRHVRELLDVPAPPRSDERLDAAGVYRRAVDGVVLVQYAGGPRAAGVVLDRARRLVLTTATAVSRDDDVVLTFPHRQGGELVCETAWYRTQDALLRQRGTRCTGVVVATDARRNLALVEASSMPADAVEMSPTTRKVETGERLHLITHPRQLEVLWTYASAHLRQVDAVTLGREADGPPPAVLVLQAPLGDREAGGPVLDGKGNIVGLLAGKVGPQQQIGFAVASGEIRAFLDEQRPLAHPATPADRLRRAELFARVHAWSRALEEYEAANSFACRAWAHYQLGDDISAIRDGSKAIALDPKDVQAHIARAASLSRGGKHAEALRDADNAVKLAPKSALAFAVRATVRLGASRVAEAVADADEAVWLDARLGMAYRVRGTAQARLGKPDPALADLSRAIACDPRDGLALLARADLHLKRNNTDAALADYEQALKLDPRDATALHGRGRCRLAKGDYGAGMEDLDRALWLAPKRLAPLVDRGGERIRRGEYRLAVADFAQAGPTLGREVLAELERRAESHLGDDPARAADLYRDTLRALLPSVNPVSLRRRAERELGAADGRTALRSVVRLLRDEWRE
jgi:tetratricopeptide (TPR) repeat protein/S1-C subfamily serine protease